MIINIMYYVWHVFEYHLSLGRLQVYADGPAYETSVSGDGSIVPALNCNQLSAFIEEIITNTCSDFHSASARQIIRRPDRGRGGRGRSRRGGAGDKEKQQSQRPARKSQIDAKIAGSSLQMLEMQIELIRWHYGGQ